MDDEITITTEMDGDRGRFVATGNETVLGEMTFSRAGATMIMVDHTEVGEAARGTDVGKQLFDAMVSWARDEKQKVVPVCPFATVMFKRHADARDVL